MSSALAVREASLDDAALLAAFGERTFRETFAGDNTPEDLAIYLAQAFGEAIQRDELSSPAVTGLIAERAERAEGGGEALGYALLREGKQASGLIAGARPVELQRLYVDSAAKGQGVAQALLGRVEEVSVRRGGDVLWLGVWEKNPRAIAFYRKCGFREAGTQVFVLGRDPQTDLVMFKPLP